MIQNKAYKIRIYPNKEQKQKINSNIGASRFIYNHFLDKKINQYKDTKTSLTYNQCSAELIQLKKDDNYNWLKDNDSTSLQQSLKNLDMGFKNFFKRGNKGFPKFKSKHKATLSYRITMSIKIQNNTLKIPKVGALKSKHTFDLSVIHKINNVTISKSKSNKYYASISCEVEVKTKPKTNQDVGIDLGIKELATLSTKEVVPNPKYYRKYEDQLKRIQRRFSKTKKGSCNREKMRIKLSRKYEKIRNSRIDYIHKFTSYLINSFDTIVIEDLSVSEMLQNHKLAKSIADASFFEIRRQLQYKTDWYNKSLIVIDKWFPSSKKCSCCGNIKNDLTLEDRTYECSNCGIIIDRDYNASINIKRVGMTQLAY